MLQWTETVEGIWYPRGGFHAVPASLQKIAESHGAKFHFSSPISHVSINDSPSFSSPRADGIYLESDATKKIEADIVIVNADLAYAHDKLFPGVDGSGKRDEGLARRLRGKKHSCSSISFYWAMDRVLSELEAHNIFLVSLRKGGWRLVEGMMLFDDADVMG